MLRPSTTATIESNTSSSSSCGTASTSSTSSLSSHGTDSQVHFGGNGCGDCQLCCTEFVEVRSPASLSEGVYKESSHFRRKRGETSNLSHWCVTACLPLLFVFAGYHFWATLDNTSIQVTVVSSLLYRMHEEFV